MASKTCSLCGSVTCGDTDELREANKAQRNQIAVTNVELAECMTQRDELRAEVEQLKSERTQYPFNVAVAARAELRECQVENERLKSQHRNDRVLLASNTSAEVELLKQEVDRLSKIRQLQTERIVKDEDEIERLREAFQADPVPAHHVAALRVENERLRAALDKHHDLLSDEPGDCCKTCGLDYLARPKE